MKELEKSELMEVEGGFPLLLVGIGIGIGLLIGYLTNP